MDINGDGILDIIGGEYTGKITLYAGTEKGFNPPVEIPQTTDITNDKNFIEYIFTNPTFADFDGDGLLDAFIGGEKGMRVMLNIGTKKDPKFGDRLPILDIDGVQISSKNLTDIEKKRAIDAKNKDIRAIDFKAYIYFIDWDNDGVGDIISTSSYGYKFEEAIDFHKGIETDEGIRFMKKIPLCTATDNTKVLPGSVFIPYLYDINSDGALDLLLGISLCCEIDKNFAISKDNNQYLYEKPQTKQDPKLKNRGFIIMLLSHKKYK